MGAKIHRYLHGVGGLVKMQTQISALIPTPAPAACLAVINYIYQELRFISMEVAAENIDMKLDEVLRRLNHVESLMVMGEAFPDDDELKAIRDYFTRDKQGETDFIPLQEIDNEL
ncbi:MAG: hypothetical protein CVV36_06750 [Candidatus Methanoperedenaceae archaeon HGW-Methanoperedenaceae-1]|nr:MAG: hypothetical protein CVV36_06750 [Candidatus Methanoperedenaceae archaeon HGW-Methanoperedenaceae-1]